MTGKEKFVCSIIDSFLLREDIENAYELAFNELMEIPIEELESYNTNDVCNFIGNYVD